VIPDTSSVVEKGLVVKENITAITFQERPAQGFPTQRKLRKLGKIPWEQQTLLAREKFICF